MDIPMIQHVPQTELEGTPAMTRCLIGHRENDWWEKIKTSESFYSLLEKIDNSPCENSEFIELNKISMVEIGPMNVDDYRFFWGCMKLYNKFAINYFVYYLYLRKGLFGNFSHGIVAWIDPNSPYHSKEDLENLVSTLRFFNFESYQGIPLQEFENALADYPLHEKMAQKRIAEENSKKSEKTINEKVQNYFNFSNFDNTLFKQYLDIFTVHQVHKEVSLNAALIEAKAVPANTFIVIFYRDGKACYVGKTDHLLKYIGDKSQKHNADSVFYHVANDEYVDDLLIAIMIYYDLSLSKVRPQKIHRKYATIQQACYAYRYAYSISNKVVLSTIDSNHLRTHEIDVDKKLIDKTELEAAIRGSLNR